MQGRGPTTLLLCLRSPSLWRPLLLTLASQMCISVTIASVRAASRSPAFSAERRLARKRHVLAPCSGTPAWSRGGRPGEIRCCTTASPAWRPAGCRRALLMMHGLKSCSASRIYTTTAFCSPYQQQQCSGSGRAIATAQSWPGCTRAWGAASTLQPQNRGAVHWQRGSRAGRREGQRGCG